METLSYLQLWYLLKKKLRLHINNLSIEQLEEINSILHKSDIL